MLKGANVISTIKHLYKGRTVHFPIGYNITEEQKEMISQIAVSKAEEIVDGKNVIDLSKCFHIKGKELDNGKILMEVDDNEGIYILLF